MIRIQITADARREGKTTLALLLLHANPKAVLVTMTPLSALKRLGLTDEAESRVWPVSPPIDADTWTDFDAWNVGRITTHVIMDLN